jgi:hypothetical protein
MPVGEIAIGSDSEPESTWPLRCGDYVSGGNEECVATSNVSQVDYISRNGFKVPFQKLRGGGEFVPLGIIKSTFLPHFACQLWEFLSAK